MSLCKLSGVEVCALLAYSSSMDQLARLTEEARKLALARFRLLQPHLEDNRPLKLATWTPTHQVTGVNTGSWRSGRHCLLSSCIFSTSSPLAGCVWFRFRGCSWASECFVICRGHSLAKFGCGTASPSSHGCCLLAASRLHCDFSWHDESAFSPSNLRSALETCWCRWPGVWRSHGRKTG